MAAIQYRVPIETFARAMLESGSNFADRVRQFEVRFGQADENTLAVLAQASYFCRFENEYVDNLVAACRAIGTRGPTAFHLCGQVTPARWVELNTYVVAVQRWLGCELALPREMDWEKIQRIRQWLGVSHPAKDWLAALYLCQLVDDLVLRTSFSKLGEDDTERGQYADYSAWYMRSEGPRYSTEHNSDCPGDGATPGSYVEMCKLHVRQEMRFSPRDAQELIANILKPAQPPCMHRFFRYQDIKLASIGALKWRGELPPDDSSRKTWEVFWKADEGVQASLERWLGGLPPKGIVALRLQRALGDPAEWKKAVVREFLLQPPSGREFYSWLTEHAQQEGATARSFLPDESVTVPACPAGAPDEATITTVPG